LLLGLARLDNRLLGAPFHLEELVLVAMLVMLGGVSRFERAAIRMLPRAGKHFAPQFVVMRVVVAALVFAALG
jgi:hypothetical protein